MFRFTTVHQRPLRWCIPPASMAVALACALGSPDPSSAVRIPSEPLHIRLDAQIGETSPLVEIETAALTRRPPSIQLDLPDGSRVTAALRTFRQRPAGATWTGHVAGSRLRRNVVFTEHRGMVAGRVDLADRSYVLEPLATGRSRLVEVVPGGPDCGVRDTGTGAARGERLAVPPAMPLAPHATAADLRAASTQPVITVLGLYTTEARDAAGGLTAIETLIQAGIDVTNTVFANSDIAARVELAATAPLDLARFGPLPSIEASIAALQQDELIGALRDAVSADLVAAIFESGGGACGFANAMDEVGPEFASQAYSITVRSCILPRLALTHEIGHNLGARHNPEDSEATPATASFPWSFGHVTSRFHTVMAYESRCAPCRSVPLFSNPDAFETIGDTVSPVGIEDERDNHRTLNLTANVAAAFRQPPPPTCVEDGSNLCLADERFEVRIEWRDAEGRAGIGRPALSASDSGLFWFFHPDNWEMMVKVLDACDVNESFWVFAAASTDIQYTLRVTDTHNGEAKSYFNPLGHAASAITDTHAFRTCELERPTDNRD